MLTDAASLSAFASVSSVNPGECAVWISFDVPLCNLWYAAAAGARHWAPVTDECHGWSNANVDKCHDKRESLVHIRLEPEGTLSRLYIRSKGTFTIANRISIIRGKKLMWVCCREKSPSYRTGVSQEPCTWRINNGGSRTVPATADWAQGRAHRWCWDGPARH